MELLSLGKKFVMAQVCLLLTKMNKRVQSKESLTTIQIPYERKSFDQLDQKAPEVLMARKDGIFSFSHKNATFANLRQIYQKQRENERMDIDAEKQSFAQVIQKLHQKYRENAVRFFASNVWIVGLCLMIIDVIFILLYLTEMQDNVGFPCKVSFCGNLNVPRYFLVERFHSTFRILVTRLLNSRPHFQY